MSIQRGKRRSDKSDKTRRKYLCIKHNIQMNILIILTIYLINVNIENRTGRGSITGSKADHKIRLYKYYEEESK